MPSTMIIKPRPVEAAQRPGPVEAAQRPGPVEAAQRPGPVRVKASSRAEAELKGSDVRKSRASSCTRGAQVRDRGERATTEPQRSTSKPSCDRRVRSTSCAPKQAENGSRTNPNHRRATSCVRQTDNPKNRDTSGCPVQREQRASRTEPKVQIQSHKAFTVIPPNPKKRREIQKKAEAELAALEELRLSRATAYVSIDPSRVGGCMSLEEVRLKQQQEMMQAKRKHSQIKKQVMEETPVRTR